MILKDPLAAMHWQTGSEETGQMLQHGGRSIELPELCMCLDGAIWVALQAFAGDGMGAHGKPSATFIDPSFLAYR